MNYKKEIINKNYLYFILISNKILLILNIENIYM